MKKILFLMLLSFSAAAQDKPVYIVGDFKVMVVQKDTLIEKRQKVVVGMYRDEFCLNFDYLMCFVDVKKDNQAYHKGYKGLMKSTNGDTYAIRMIIEKDHGMCVWLSNLNKGYPHIFITTYRQQERYERRSKKSFR